jgi:hypothetical protein
VGGGGGGAGLKARGTQQLQSGGTFRGGTSRTLGIGWQEERSERGLDVMLCRRMPLCKRMRRPPGATCVSFCNTQQQMRSNRRRQDVLSCC